jgi:hypothetical protein
MLMWRFLSFGRSKATAETNAAGTEWNTTYTQKIVDLFYVAAAYRLGNVLREDPTLREYLYFAGCYAKVLHEMVALTLAGFSTNLQFGYRLPGPLGHSIGYHALSSFGKREYACFCTLSYHWLSSVYGPLGRHYDPASLVLLKSSAGERQKKLRAKKSNISPVVKLTTVVTTTITSTVISAFLDQHLLHQHTISRLSTPVVLSLRSLHHLCGPNRSAFIESAQLSRLSTPVVLSLRQPPPFMRAWSTLKGCSLRLLQNLVVLEKSPICTKSCKNANKRFVLACALMMNRH